MSKSFVLVHHGAHTYQGHSLTCRANEFYGDYCSITHALSQMEITLSMRMASLVGPHGFSPNSSHQYSIRCLQISTYWPPSRISQSSQQEHRGQKVENDESTREFMMYSGTVLFALLAYTGSVVTSPVSGDLFRNDCDGKKINDACMALDSISLDVHGVCRDEFVSTFAYWSE